MLGMALGAPDVTYAQSAVTPPGSGTEADPYRISELGHLVWVSETLGGSSGQYYSLTADIDASPTASWNDPGTDTSVLEGFRPIGTYSDPDTTSFRGVFDGNGHTIRGLVVNRSLTDCGGLFGLVGADGQVRKLGLIGGAVTADAFVGGLVGENRGTISGCYASGAATGASHVGNLVGINRYGTVSDCHTSGSITGRDFVGGLVGWSECGTVSGCHATGAVTGSQDVGGLAGVNYQGTVSSCRASGAVTGQGYVGGLLGVNRQGKVSIAYATGAVKGYYRLGGLVGAGLGGTLSTCFATGTVTGSSSDIGGLVGYDERGTVSISYGDMETSGLATSAGGTGKTTSEMKQQATFVGWDFAAIWGIREDVTYPWLRSLDADGDGISDVQDDCGDSDLAATILIDGCDTGVVNQPLGEGCTIADEIAKAAAGARNHGQFVSAVAHLTEAWLAAGRITDADKGRIQRCAGRADFDADGDVDTSDFRHFHACFNGPNQRSAAARCEDADLDSDGDVDLIDFGRFQACFNGLNRPPKCRPA